MNVNKNKKMNMKSILVTLMIVINSLIIFYFTIEPNILPSIKFQIQSDTADTYQIFYSTGEEFKEENSCRIQYIEVGKKEWVSCRIPRDVKRLRFDIGTRQMNSTFSHVELTYLLKNIDITEELLNNKNEVNTLEVTGRDNKTIDLKAYTNDSYLIIDLESQLLDKLFSQENQFVFIIKIIMCIITNILLWMIYKTNRTMRLLSKEIYINRTLMLRLAKSDFKIKYAGSYLGTFWGFVQPVIIVLIYRFVFQVGFKTPSVQNVPFILWLVAGLVPWFFFSDAIINATNAMTEYSYLVKKVVFNISILPIAKVLSAFFIHIFFVVFSIGLALSYGYNLSIYTFQVIYYSGCMFVLVVGICYTTSAIIVFFKDLNQIISIVLQIGIWMTPIMWNYQMIPQRYQWILKINPMYYIVEGYRDSLVNHVWFWERYNQTIYFWVVAIILLSLGMVIFRKLRDHFADVL